MLVVIFLDPINDRLIRTFWTADVAGIDAFTAGDNEVGICTVNLCPVRDTEVPTLVEMDMACGVGVLSVGVLGLLVTEPTLNCGTIILPAEVETFFGKDLGL